MSDPYASESELRRENQILRRMLAINYAGVGLYTDDGELQDGRARPSIDFKRDDINTIRKKMEKRAKAQLVPASPPPSPAQNNQPPTT